MQGALFSHWRNSTMSRLLLKYVILSLTHWVTSLELDCDASFEAVSIHRYDSIAETYYKTRSNCFPFSHYQEDYRFQAHWLPGQVLGVEGG